MSCVGSSSLSVARAISFFSLTAVQLLVTGCGMGALSPTGVDAESQGAEFTGVVHGGQNPVTGATVTLWAFGETGYGSAATSLATATTDSNGNFAFQGTGTAYTCTGTQYLYITSQGGNAGGGDNSAISLMTILAGPNATGVLQDTCALVKSAKPAITINEVTTAASIFALQQFFNASAESGSVVQFGTSATNVTGLTNALLSLGSVLNLAAGTVNTTYQPYGVATISSSHLNITATPEQQKIYLIADILAACVNSTGSSSSECTTLFDNAMPPPTPAATTLGSGASYPTASDTLLAGYYMAVNPINASTAGVANNTKIGNLYGLASGTPPFVTTAPQPTDWSIAVTYGSSVENGATYVVSEPSNLSIDANGNVWFISTTSSSVETLSVLNNTGGLAATSLTSLAPFQGLALDSNGVGYIARSSNTKYVYGVTLGSGSFTEKYALFTDSVSAADVTPSVFAAGGTDIFFPVVANDYVYEVSNEAQAGSPYIGSGTATATALTAVNDSNAISGLTAASGMAVDSSSHLWVAGTGNNTLYKMSYPAYPVSSGTAPTAYAGGAFNAPSSVAVDHSGNVWVANGTGGTPADGFLTELPSATPVAVNDTTVDDGGVNYPTGVAVDGAGNVWVASSGVGTTLATPTVSEFALVGGTLTAFSPLVGFTHSYNAPGSIAIDASGNVWVANAGGVATATVPGTVTEILGAAVPVVTPIALGVKNGTLGTLP